MGRKTGIEWTHGPGYVGATWTPVRALNKKTGKVGWHCEHKSEGCRNCYAESLNIRLGTGLPYKPGHRQDVEIFLDDRMILDPLRWRKPSMIFPCSMTDIGADFVRPEWLDRMFAVMALCPQHIFQPLTKRTDLLRAYLTDDELPERLSAACGAMLDGEWIWKDGKPFRHAIERLIGAFLGSDHDDDGNEFCPDDPLPLRNVWIGASVEDQRAADERREDMRAIADLGYLTWVSYEPALGPVDWSGWEFIRWLVSGGESGPKSRPHNLDWHRAARDYCVPRGIAYFLKQHGNFLPGDLRTEDDGSGRYVAFPDGEEFHVVSDGHDIVLSAALDHRGDPRQIWQSYWASGDGRLVKRVRNKDACRLLDGQEWTEFPMTSNREEVGHG